MPRFLVLILAAALIAPPASEARGFDAAGIAYPYPEHVVPGGRGPWLEAIDAREDGTIVAAGVEDDQLVVIRFLADGLPDPAFGGSGAVTERVGIPPDGGMPLTVQALASTPDGGVVVVGGARFGPDRMRLFARRYHANGVPVSSFGAGGTFVLTHPDAHTSVGFGVAVDATGRVVVTGMVNTYAYGPSPSDLVVLRLSPNGQLDPSYGSGGRTVITEGGIGTAVRLATNGDAVVSSTTMQPVPSPDPGGGATNHDHTDVSRFNEAGARTSTLRWRRTDPHHAENPARDLALLPGDRPLVASCDQFGYARAFAIFDAGLSGAAFLEPPFGACPTAVATLADGRIAWAGEAFAGPLPGARWVVGLLRPDGTPDPGFAGGSVVTDTSEAPASILYPVRAMDVEGNRIVVTGLDRRGQFVTSLGLNGARWVPPATPPLPRQPGPRPPGRLPGASTPRPTPVSLGRLPRIMRVASDGRLALAVRCAPAPCTVTATATVKVEGKAVRYTAKRRLTRTASARISLRPARRSRGLAVRRAVRSGRRLKARVRITAVAGENRKVATRTVTVVR